jgi:hypothetical protein
MAQTAVRIFFHYRHDVLGQELNQWLSEVSGQVVITGISLDSNDLGHSLAVLYQVGEGGRQYRAHLFFHRRHDALDQEANAALAAAQAQWGRFVAIGSNQQGHCLCVIEEQ